MKRAREQAQGGIPILTLPAADASENELVEHFKKSAIVLACLPYDDAVHCCLTCCKLGENITGKKDNPAGRNRFCSDECEARFTRRWALYNASRAPEKGKTNAVTS
jgi:hypothetical protein